MKKLHKMNFKQDLKQILKHQFNIIKHAHFLDLSVRKRTKSTIN